MKKTIAAQLAASGWAFDVNTDGITHEESLAGPAGGNCLNWVAGHLVATYSKLLAGLGLEPVWTEERAEPYRRGAGELADPTLAVDFAEIRADLATATQRTIETVMGLSDEDLAGPAPFSPRRDPDETVESLLGLIAFHQAYHTGQTGLLRRAAGKAGAIR